MYRSREQLEHNEATVLGPCALLSGRSRGRQHPEPEPAWRTAFQRDRDRILHSAAFRRLEYKTQVFVNDAGDYFRTRLTHTLEMAQIGRALARALAANEDLVEAICLAHDLGHPPFGHVGENVLDRLATDVGGFDHNLQGWRIVTRLEQRFRDWPGLNLTWETLEGILRHETERDLAALAGFDAGLRGSLEAQLANISDALAYNAHDLDDGLQAGLLRAEDLATLEIWRELCDRSGWQGGLPDDIARHHLIRELIGLQVGDVLEQTAQRLQTLNPATAQSLQTHCEDVVGHSPGLQDRNRELANFLHGNLYRHERIAQMAERAERCLEVIFHGCIARPEMLPMPFRARLAHGERSRVVVDYIASLTDRSALQAAQTLTKSAL